MKITNEDNMKLMARYEDNHFDLAIVDPPYGIDIMNNKGKGIKGGKSFLRGKNGFKKYKAKEWDKHPPQKEYFKELFRVSKNQIIWGGNHFVEDLPPRKCWIVWDKTQRDFSFSDGELAFTSFETKLKIFTAGRGVIVAEGKIHPTQKPVKLYEWLLMNYAKENDKILDTHLGSGSIAIACHNLGFDLTACELDKDYYNSAMKRIEQHKQQIRMF